MVCKDTLRIKHLPKELTDAQKEDFIRHFGAYKVKVITSKAKAKSVVYAKFENEEIAKNVMARLHQINILTCRLCVEYAETDLLQGQLTTQKVEDKRDGPDKRFFKNFINSINAFNDSVGFYQPPPSHLKYNYPKANRPTINNIAHALATVPRFYTQVLHLMNKMNLPPPFAMPEPPVRTIPAGQVSQPPVAALNPERVLEKRKAPSSSSESELESDGESNKRKEILPQKRAVIQKKMLKRPKFIKQSPAQSSTASKSVVGKAENVFDKVEVHPQRKIELKVTQEPPKHVKQSSEKKGDPLPCKAIDELASPSGKLLDFKPFVKEEKDLGQKLELSKPSDEGEKLEAKTVVNDVKDPKEVLIKDASSLVDKTKSVVNLYEDVLVLDESIEPDFVKKVESDQVLQPQQRESSASNTENSVPKRQEIIESHTVEPQEEPLVEATKLDNPDNLLQTTNESQSKQSTVLKNEETAKVSTEAPLSEDEFPCISLEELAANQITDLSVTAVFKNYSAGDPTNKLYIKNCAKNVAVQDLEYIYNRYREEGTEGKPSEFNIRLMQEGRMKGQAFVTLDSVGQAQRAVKETNGFILKDKPLVVVFGKAGKKK